MLEGLEISEINYKYLELSNDVFRIDSNYFKKEFIQEESIIKRTKNKTLKNLGVSLLSFGAYSLNNFVEYKSVGIPFIRGINMKGGRISFNDMIYIDQEANKLLWKSEVTPETVLLSMSGTIGDVAIASNNWNYPINSNQDIAKIRTNGNINPYYLYVFFLTRFGQNYLIREARGSVQQHVYLSQMELFNIPIFSTDFERNIEDLILSLDELQNLSKNRYKQAESLLLNEIGLNNFNPSKDPINIKSFKKSLIKEGRIDSEYYLLKYEQLREYLKNYKLGYKNLGDISKTFRGDFVQEEYYNSENGIKYIRGADISSNQISSDKLMKLSNGFKHTNEHLTEKGDIVIALIGSVGTASLITEDYINSIVSNNLGLIRVFDNRFFPIYIHLFLTHRKIGQLLFKQKEMRTAQPKISDKDIWDFPVPILDINKQKQIAELVEESFKLKSESEKLLDVAKKTVEIAIEVNEASAIKFINENIKQNGNTY